MLTDPAAKARVLETTALRVLEKNDPTAMEFPVMDNHVVSATLDHLLVVVNDLHMVTGHHDLIAQIAQDMQTVVSETNVLPMVIVPSGEIVLHTANAVNVPDMAIVMVLPVAPRNSARVRCGASNGRCRRSS